MFSSGGEDVDGKALLSSHGDGKDDEAAFGDDGKDKVDGSLVDCDGNGEDNKAKDGFNGEWGGISDYALDQPRH